MVDMAKYEAMIKDLSTLESQITILKNQFEDTINRNKELEVALEKSKQDNTSLYQKIAALDKELTAINKRAEAGLSLLSLEDKESFKNKLQDLISRINYHMSAEGQA
jgi:chromosome segregation ATPase